MNDTKTNGFLRTSLPPRKLTETEINLLRDLQWALVDGELSIRYPDQYVAVRNRQILAAGSDEVQVLAEAQRISGLSKDHIAIVFIQSAETFLAVHN